MLGHRADCRGIVSAGTRLVTEGEYSDGYFAIADGVVEVTCDGRHLRTLGRGEGFGEIGLIRNIERTATVTAVTDAVLLSIESGPFITAVTGHPDSLQRADAIIDELLT